MIRRISPLWSSHCLRLLTGGLLQLCVAAAPPMPSRRADVVVYGATAGGIISAISAAQLGATVVVADPEHHIGGMLTGGLGMTDVGVSASIGGMSRDFYRRIAKHYAQPAAWRWQTREDFLQRKDDLGGSTPVQEGECWWRPEPSAAATILRAMITEAGVELLLSRRLTHVAKSGGKLRELHLSDGTVLAAATFIDATYEGDLMAQAGVSYRIGRESSAEYGERVAGVVPRELSTRKQWRVDVSPYDSDGRLLFGIQSGERGRDGAGDKKVQAYNYRICLTDHPENRLPISPPPNYTPQHYELALRYILGSPGISLFRGPSGAYRGDALLKLDRLPNRKTDLNDGGPFSTDFIGASWNYPDGDVATRRQIVQEHFEYTVGLLYFLGNDPRVPATIRREMLEWGLPRDEYPDSGHWSPQLYVREARRMLGDYVMTSHDLSEPGRKADSIGLASYTADSHHVQRIAEGGAVRNEGNPNDHTPPGRPYEIPYRAITPHRGECENLLVTFCVSASHLAFASIRMEPVFMIVGESAGVAAALAARTGTAVQDVPYQSLQTILVARNQRLKVEDAVEKPAPRSAAAGNH